jgi:hypothetical protein
MPGPGCCGEGLDGYAWTKAPESTKVFLMYGYLTGFSTGESYGMSLSKAKPIGPPEDDKWETNMYIKFYDFKKSPEYYSKEVNSFYQTYPLCKSKQFPEMIFNLLMVWKDNSKISYKHIGESCSVKD